MQTKLPSTQQELAFRIAACLQRQALGERSKQTTEENARLGIYTGKPLNGYVKTSGCETHQVDEDKREAVTLVWDLAGPKGWPLRKLLAECERVGLKSASGGKMSLNSLHLILTIPF